VQEILSIQKLRLKILPLRKLRKEEKRIRPKRIMMMLRTLDK